jgi:hypothetical protein
LTTGAGLWLIGGSSTTWQSLQLPYLLTPFGMTGCTLYTSVDLSLPFLFSNGKAIWAMQVPSGAALVGATVYMQAWIPDSGVNPAGFITSEGLTAVLGI